MCAHQCFDTAKTRVFRDIFALQPTWLILVDVWENQAVQKMIYIKDYADAKFGCVPVAFHLNIWCSPTILSSHWVASFGLRNRDTYNFSACVMSDADAKKFKIQCILKVCMVGMVRSSMNRSTFNEYEHRLHRQVGAPRWFSPTLTLIGYKKKLQRCEGLLAATFEPLDRFWQTWACFKALGNSRDSGPSL